MVPLTPSPIIEAAYRKQMIETYNLTETDLDRLLVDILQMTDQDFQTWVRRRHTELQAMNWKNDYIYAQIQKEIPFRRFATPVAGARKIRRIIYG